MKQRCTRRVVANCKEKPIPIKIKKAANSYINVHTFNSKSAEENVNIDFIQSINIAGKVFLYIKIKFHI